MAHAVCVFFFFFWGKLCKTKNYYYSAIRKVFLGKWNFCYNKMKMKMKILILIFLNLVGPTFVPCRLPQFFSYNFLEGGVHYRVGALFALFRVSIKYRQWRGVYLLHILRKIVGNQCHTCWLAFYISDKSLFFLQKKKRL